MDRGLIIFLIAASLSLGTLWAVLSRPKQRPGIDSLTVTSPGTSPPLVSPAPASSEKRGLVLEPEVLPSADTSPRIPPSVILAPDTSLLSVVRGQKPPSLPDSFPADGHRLPRARIAETLTDPASIVASGTVTGGPGGASGEDSGTLQRYRIQDGDTLPKLARRFYGDEERWRVIYEANRGRIADPDLLPIGTEIIIPDSPGGQN